MSYRRERREEKNEDGMLRYEYNLSSRRQHNVMNNATNNGETDTTYAWKLLALGIVKNNSIAVVAETSKSQGRPSGLAGTTGACANSTVMSSILTNRNSP